MGESSAWGLAVAALLAGAGCAENLWTDSGCDKPGSCDGSGSDGGARDGGPSVGPDGLAPPSSCEAEGGTACGALCCRGAEVCVEGGCFPFSGCTDNDGCGDDAYCAEGACVPYEGEESDVPEGIFDPTCALEVVVAPFDPVLQCAYADPPAGDPAPLHVQVMSTPMVADLDMDDDPSTLRPSIVFSTFAGSAYGSDGVLRIVDGETCSLQQTLADGADRTVAAASVALGDLGGDPRPEIVAPASGGGLVAFGWDDEAGGFRRIWRSGSCGADGSRTPDSHGAGRWAGAAIHDLDDAWPPEIVFGAVVYDAAGCIVTASVGEAVYSAGYVPVLADVDLDGRVELVQGNAIHEFDAALRDWVSEPYFAGTGLAAGQVALADFGPFEVGLPDPGTLPEIAVISSGMARVQTIEGGVIFEVAQPGGGTGGPPTASDFDGDGRAELAAAGLSTYTVYDLDCLPGGDPTLCGTGRTDGILWSQPSQDGSSRVTGSSIFDFEGDGAAEALYADECYLRAYRGSTGEVIFSQARSSGTTYENPVVADVDGDFNSELLTSVNDYAGALGCPAADPLYPAAPFATGHGIRVYSDASDLWMGSRPIWNQHGYAVTNVGDRGEIPLASEVEPNWTVDGLNNFRQQVQDGLEALAGPDLTVHGSDRRVLCEGEVELAVVVCNRGAAPIAAGIGVELFLGAPPAEDAEPICVAATTGPLEPGQCEEVTCAWEGGAPGEPIEVTAVVDGEGAERECWEANNWAVFTPLCEEVPG